MARGKTEYEFGDELLFDEARRPVGTVVKRVLEVALLSLAVAVGLYAVFALVVNTDTEARLKRENRMYAKLYSELSAQEKMLEDAVGMLESKDNDIYAEVFDAVAPSLNPAGALTAANGADSIPDVRLVFYTNEKARALCSEAMGVEENLREALRLAAQPGAVFPPMALPLSSLKYTQVGASKGSKMDPLLGAYVEHKGVDMIVPQGRTVMAAADGQVVKVEKSSKGQGNLVEIQHEGGYTTKYCHMASIGVKQWQRVKKGQKLGTVGSSGQTTAPHLHYEVKLGKEAWLDPVNCFFADLGCDAYVNYLFMGSKTQKSLD